MLAKRLAIIYILASFFCTLTQIALGGSVFIASAFFLMSAFAAEPILKKRALVVTDVLFVFYVMYTATLTLWLKTFLGQTVETNLRNPAMSTLMICFGFASLYAGYRFCGSSSNSESVFRFKDRLSKVQLLERVSKGIFLLGTIFESMHVIFAPRLVEGGVNLTSGFGGFGSFEFLLPLGVTCQCALVVARPSRRERFWLVCMVMVVFLLSIAANVKFLFVRAILAVALTFVLAGRAKLTKVHLGVGIGVALFVYFVLSPIIHVMRNDIADLSFAERIPRAFLVLYEHNFNLNEIISETDRILESFEASDSVGNYLYPSVMNVDRFMLIFPVDQVMRQIDSVGVLGLDVLSDIKSIVPGFLINKGAATSPDMIAWYYGFRPFGTISRPVVGLYASCLALGGIGAIIVIPGLIFFFIGRVLNGVSGVLNGNVWGIFIAVSTAYLAEKEVSQILVFFMRDFLIMMATTYLIVILAKPRFGAG
jgi:hypothetical protein